MFVWQSEFHLRGWIKPESLIQGSLAENQIIGSIYGRERSDLLDTESLHLWINWNTLNRTSQCYTRSVIPSKKQNHQGIIKCLIGSNVLVIFRHIVKKIREQVLFLVYWICFLSLLDQLGQEWTKRCSLLKVATVARCWEKTFERIHVGSEIRRWPRSWRRKSNAVAMGDGFRLLQHSRSVVNAVLAKISIVTIFISGSIWVSNVRSFEAASCMRLLTVATRTYIVIW